MNIKILQPYKIVFYGKGDKVILRTLDGEIEILPGHAQYSGIVSGYIKVIKDGKEIFSFEGEGIAKVDGEVNILIL